jgi:hypothetical protein
VSANVPSSMTIYDATVTRLTKAAVLKAFLCRNEKYTVLNKNITIPAIRMISIAVSSWLFLV